MRVSESILKEFQEGHIASFYMEYYPSLLRYATRLLGENRVFLAEDCVQEAIYKLYHSRKDFDSILQVKSYLLTCIHNEIITIYRKDDRHNRYLETKDLVEEDFTNQYILQETLDKLFQAIDRLPDELRQIFDLSFEQGMKNKDIAALLSLSPETIKKRKARLIRSLREELKEEKSLLSLLYLISTI